MRLYPQAKKRDRRLSLSSPAGRSLRLKFLRLTVLFLVILAVLFLALLCYIFGALFQQNVHAQNLAVAFVDYDTGGTGGDVIGTAVRNAYQQLRGDSFPTLVERSPLEYPGPSALRSAVCRTDFWAAFYIAPGASDRLVAGLAGGAASASYNRSDVLTYIWNEARYSATADTVSAALETLSEAARIAYAALNGTGAVQMMPATDAAAVSVFASPWQLVSVNIQPTVQGARLVYNTLVIILIMLQEFFFLATINGLFAQFKIYGRVSPRRIMATRLVVSAVYTLVGSLFTTVGIWAFRSGWHVDARQFVLTWMSLWLFAHLNFLTFDVFSIWLPPAYLPMALITWVVINITSILVPFPSSPAFYRWAYALPTHAVFNVLIDIWSAGCNDPALAYALPVMFAYELSSLALSLVGVYKRSHLRFILLENEEKAFQEKIAKALAEASRDVMIGTGEEEEEGEEGEKDSLDKKRTEAGSSGESRPATAANGEGEEELGRAESAVVPEQKVGTIATLEGREEMANYVWRETTRAREEQARAERSYSMGPTFDLPFGGQD